MDLLQGVLAVDRLDDLEALELEVDGDQRADDVAVVDDQHAAQAVVHARRLTRRRSPGEGDLTD